MKNARFIKIAAPVLLAVFGTVAVSTTAEAASSPAAVHASVVRPLYWYDTGVAYNDYNTCADWGEKAVESGNFYGWACEPNGDGSYELWLDTP